MRAARIVLGWLGIILIASKLTEHLDLSWWAVTAPMWVPAVFAVAVFAACGLVVGIAASRSGR